MTNAETKRSYPYMSVPAWATVRKAIVRAVPKNFSLDYVQSVLGVTEKTAKNILPQFKNMGIVDADGQLTQLGLDIRSDQHYPEACRKIVEEVYPSGLLDAFPEPGEQGDEIAQWFMRNANSGQAGARIQTKFFVMLTSGQVPDVESKKRLPKDPKEANSATKVQPEKKTPTNSVREPSSKKNSISKTTTLFWKNRAAKMSLFKLIYKYTFHPIHHLNKSIRYLKA
ncbi:DUF5343 domain-containing protein [Rhodococcus fascians]|nr:DUF5343 domain-containing protein [Rhodococcus fascians]MBY4434309.1 DUF5343 domain-containing protein [Rhodococcus fascians]